MTTGVTCPVIIPQYFDAAGNPLAGGSLLFQVGGVDTAVYQDPTLVTALPNPVPLNSRGETSTAAGASVPIFLQPATTYTVTLSDANGNQIWQQQYVGAGA